MCGIVGYFSFQNKNQITQEELLEMTRPLAHRGPDDSGCVIINEKGKLSSAGTLGLGHQRLSILDLSQNGHQPMETLDGQVWLAYNGEVYNYIELRQELTRLGHTFFSTSDTEVVLKSYIEWGTECFKRFNGMWALAIYDLRSDELILSRDRFGKKPLYYYQDDQALIFSSEIKAILKHPSVKKGINLAKCAAYAGVNYRFVDNDHESFFKDIFHLPKSMVVKFRRDGSFAREQYWSLNVQETPLDEAGVIERFQYLLNDAVALRLRSDVPIGLTLSGGLDSTSIASLAVRHSSKITAFCGVTGPGTYDESAYMKEVIQATGIQSEFIHAQPTPLIETLQEMLTFHDEPVCTSTWYSLYLISKEIAKKGMKVALTGHAGDELLGGYWHHYHFNFNDLRKRDPSQEQAEVEAWRRNHARPENEYEDQRSFVESVNADPAAILQKYSQYIPALSPALRNQLGEVPAPALPGGNALSKRLYSELFFETIPASLRAEDRNMMAHSVENRVPFLDYRLVEFCFSLPNQFKVRDGLGKWLIRESMKGILPDKVRLRKDKVGHNVPAETWFRKDIRADLEYLIESPSPVNRLIYDQNVVKDLFQQHQRGANHKMFFWQYLNLCLWYQTYFD